MGVRALLWQFNLRGLFEVFRQVGSIETSRLAVVNRLSVWAWVGEDAILMDGNWIAQAKNALFL